LKGNQLDVSDAHSAQAFTVSEAIIQTHISFHVAASGSELLTKLGGNNIQFQAVDQLTVISVQDSVNDQDKKLLSFGLETIVRIIQFKLRVDHTGNEFHVKVVAHVLVTVHDRVIGLDAVVKVHKLLDVFQKLSVRLILKL
jgi:hypothetical protein